MVLRINGVIAIHVSGEAIFLTRKREHEDEKVIVPIERGKKIIESATTTMASSTRKSLRERFRERLLERRK